MLKLYKNGIYKEVYSSGAFFGDLKHVATFDIKGRIIFKQNWEQQENIIISFTSFPKFSINKKPN